MNCHPIVVLGLLVGTQFLTCLHATSAKIEEEGKQTRIGGLGRISGGKIPAEGKYPSLARLVRIADDGTTLRHKGGATILNRDWIITSASNLAARYQKIRNISRLRVIVGDSILNETEPYEQMVAVERVIIHEGFDSFKHQYDSIHDIALAKVVPPIKFSNRVTAVNLPACDEMGVGSGWIPGFGDEADGPIGGSGPTHRLYEAQNPIVTNEECNKWMEDNKLGLRVTKLLMCTRQVDKMGWCWYDHGTPLFLIKNESYMVQVGIASIRPIYGRPCGYDGHMTVYTRLSEYLGWIRRRISGCGNHPFYNITGVDDV